MIESMCRVIVIPAIWMGSLFLPQCVADDAVDADLKAFEGVWVSTDDTGESTWTFKGDRLELVTPTRKYEISLKLDPTAKPHKTIELIVQPNSPNAAGYTAPGIYKIEGDKAAICFGDDQSGRPEKFESNFPSAFFFELTRKKD